MDDGEKRVVEGKSEKLVEWFKKEEVFSVEMVKEICFLAQMQMHLSQPEIQVVLENPELVRDLFKEKQH